MSFLKEISSFIEIPVYNRHNTSNHGRQSLSAIPTYYVYTYTDTDYIPISVYYDALPEDI